MINKYLQNFKSFNILVPPIHSADGKPKNSDHMAMTHLPLSFFWLDLVVESKRSLSNLH